MYEVINGSMNQLLTIQKYLLDNLKTNGGEMIEFYVNKEKSYFDNIAGEGLFGIAQPLFHPIEFARGAIKLSQGAPDELMARRVALAHLKESLKDIYSGELIVIGSPDIRPHDLVYLADVYERMYGIFEVEQVVHHFTPNMGFITSITPNALVTINDPARWFMSSWIHSWMSIQNIRNDTRNVKI